MSDAPNTGAPPATGPHSRRGWRYLLYAGGSVAILFVGVLTLFDWNWLKAPIERAVLVRTGRALHIDGPIAGTFSWHPRLQFQGVRYANPPWASDSWFLQAERVALTVSLRSLLWGPVEVEDVELATPQLSLEVGRDDQRSWRFAASQRDADRTLLIRRVSVSDGKLRYLDAGEGTDVQTTLAATAEQDAHFALKGRFRGQPLNATITTDPLHVDPHGDDGLAIRGQGTVADANLRVSGRLGKNYGLEGAVLQIVMRGSDLSLLRPVFQAALPATPPYRLTGALEVREREIHLRIERSTVGDSTLSGELRLLQGAPRPRVEGTLVADPLDFDDLGPLVGAPPGTRAGETASAAQRALAQTIRTNQRVLPDAKFDTALWPKVDFDVTLEARRAVNAPTFPIDGFTVRTQLRDGRLALAPIDVRVAGGRYRGELHLDRAVRGVELKSTGRFEHMKLVRLMPGTKKITQSFGEVNGALNLEGAGTSFAQVLAGANGHLGLVVESGQISTLVLEMVGLDAFESLKFLIGGDRPTRVRCAVAGLPIEHGIIRAGAVVIDTDDTNIVIGGQASLAAESLDFTAYPTPKDWSPLALRGPLQVRGTFAHPTVAPDLTRVAARGLGAVLLGLVNPLAALVPLIETGGGTDSDCGKLIADVRRGAKLRQFGQPKRGEQP